MFRRMTLNTGRMRSQVRSARSRASMVFSKVGGSGSRAIRTTAACRTASDDSSASLKWAAFTRSHGGTPPYGPDHSSINTFVCDMTDTVADHAAPVHAACTKTGRLLHGELTCPSTGGLNPRQRRG